MQIYNPFKQLLLLLLLLSSALGAKEALNGTTALLTFEKVPPNATLHYENRSIPLLSHPLNPLQKIALLPINYRSKTGEKKLSLQWGEKSQSFAFRVKKGDYAFESITVAPSKVTPAKKDTKRIAQEFHEAMALYNSFTPQRYWKAPFIEPMTSRITSPFGTARNYNGKLKSFHSGTDFKAETGTPVYTINDGVVVIARDRYYAGNSVVVDHGEGLYSCYYHLSRIDVNVGDSVAKGQQLGLTGETGRVTGPHLHFAVMLHGVQVDPLQLIETLNSLF